MTLYAKLWCDILGDPKLMRAAREGSRQLVVLPWLIAFAKRADDEGRLTIGGKPVDSEDISRDIPNVSRKKVAQCLLELQKIGILEVESGGILRFASWEKRATSSKDDSKGSSAERMRRYRDKRRRELEERRGALPNVTDGDVTSDNVTVTGGDAALESIEKREENTDVTSRDVTASRPTPSRAPSSPEEDAVIDHYRAAHPRRRPGEKERVVIQKALKLGYSASDLCEAIDGNAADPWHRDKGKHELSYVLRDNGLIDTFRAKFDAKRTEPNLGVINGWMSPELDHATRPSTVGAR